MTHPSDDHVEDRRARRQARVREAILDAAEQVLGDRGDLSALRMEDIAAEAGYTAGALYGYFPSRQALVAALLERILDEMDAALELARKAGPGVLERIEALSTALEGTARRHVGLFHAFLLYGWEGGGSEQARLEARHAHFVEGLSELFAHGIAEGVLRDVPPLDLALAYLGIHKEFFCHWLRSDRSVPYRERAGAAHALFFAGAKRRSNGDPS